MKPPRAGGGAGWRGLGTWAAGAPRTSQLWHAERRPAGGGSPVAGFWGEGVPFRECFFVSLRATRKQPTPTLIKKKASGEEPAPRRSASSPRPGLPARRLARRAFAPSSPCPGSRARGGAEKRIEERFGNVMGLGRGGGAALSPPPSSPSQGAPILQPHAGSLAPFLYLGHSQDN